MVDSLNNCVTGVGGRWNAGAIVSVVLDTERKYAYLQNDNAVRSVNGKTGAVVLTAADVGAAASSHTHGAGDIKSGTLSVARGGTGHDFSSIPKGAVIRNSADNTGLWYTQTASGALYATAANANPTFGTLPVAQGGTGVTSLTNLLKAMFPSSATATYIPVFGSSWGSAGYATPKTVRNAMGLGDTTGALPVANGGTGNTSVDTTPTSGSTKMVTSGGVYTALSGKAGTSAATQSANGLMSAADKKKLDGIATGATKITVDSALSSSSTNPVQNKVINSALAGKAASSHNHAASEITSGTLAVARGGTGVTSIAALKTALSVTYAAQIATGSYTGTGTYGSANPCSLTFNFVPKILWVYVSTNGYLNIDEFYDLQRNAVFITNGTTSAPIAGSVSGSSSAFSNTFTWGTTVSWYSAYNNNNKDVGAATQLNYSGYTYKYIAIG